jgi:hypothetical protein
MYIDLRVKYPLFLSDFNETWIFSTDFRKSWNIIFYENPSGGSRVFPCGRKDGEAWRSWQSLFAILLKAAKNPWQRSLLGWLSKIYNGRIRPQVPPRTLYLSYRIHTIISRDVIIVTFTTTGTLNLISKTEFLCTSASSGLWTSCPRGCVCNFLCTVLNSLGTETINEQRHLRWISERKGESKRNTET